MRKQKFKSSDLEHGYQVHVVVIIVIVGTAGALARPLDQILVRGAELGLCGVRMRSCGGSVESTQG